ncbi:hypothetical protein MTR67_002858 [Solanum verrucosum]|uniref:Reverse transcriptase zinc-binding domain-containing protein n=1 Tax=Solanum verrucosum TaxID=315347 RepID=A0AAF0T9U7_SOLVR|nr:hypothetical protein MTR67_002858 [Solanum verrucosum]
MSLFPIPAKVVEKLDRLRRSFLWHGNKEGKGYCLVNWKTVLLSKEIGGLGIRNLRLQNESLLMKWLWRYTGEERALWKEIIVAKYGELNPWCIENVSEPYGVGVWRTIRNLWPQMEANLYLKVGNGNKTKFWKDGWVNQTSLKNLFPNLFLICENPKDRVCVCWTEQGWNISFRRRLNDWEIEGVAALLGTLGGISIIPTATDRVLWKLSRDGVFSVKSAYKSGLHEMTSGTQYPWRYFWNSVMHAKVKGFTWLVIRRACLTQEVLQKKGRQLFLGVFFAT